MSKTSLRLAFLSAALCTIALSGCGGGGGSSPPDVTNPPPTTPPAPTGELIVDFPPARVFVEAISAPDITVRGRASADAAIAGVTVNGIAATSDDGFANWQVTVPLKNPDGENVIEATLAIVGGVSSPATEVTVITVPPLPFDPFGLAFDPATGALYVSAITRKSVYAWKSDARDRFELIAGEDRRAGKPPLDVRSWYLAWDVLGNRLLFGDNGKLFGMDPATGNLTVVADNDSKGQGPDMPFFTPLLATDPANDSAYAVYSGFGVETLIFHIDLASGDRNLIPIDSGEGPVPGVISAVAIDAAGGYLYLAEYTTHDVIGINLNDGSRSTVIEDSLHSVVQGMVFDPVSGGLIFTVNLGNDRTVYQADVESGAVSVISDNATGQGVAFGRLSSVALAHNGRVYVADTLRDSIFEVDLQTGDRQVALLQLGGGTSWTLPGDLVLSEDGAALRVVDNGGDRIIALPLDGGGRTLFVAEDAMNSTPLHMVHALDAPMLYVQDLAARLHSVDPVTSTVTSLSVNARTILGSSYVSKYIVDHGLQQAWFLVEGLGNAEDAIGRIDLATGEGEIISGTDKGAGEPLTRASAIAMQPESGQIVAWHEDAVVYIGPDSGDREFRPLPQTLSAFKLDYDAGMFIAASYDGIYRYSPEAGTLETLISRDSGKGMSGTLYDGSFAYDNERRVIYQSSYNLGAVVAIDAVTGQEVILAR